MSFSHPNSGWKFKRIRHFKVTSDFHCPLKQYSYWRKSENDSMYIGRWMSKENMVYGVHSIDNYLTLENRRKSCT